MAITIIKDLPSIVSTRNNTWMEVELSSGPTLKVEISHASAIIVTLKFPTDSNDRVQFNLRRFLEAMGTLSSLIDVHLPAFEQTIPNHFSRSLKSFKVILTELDNSGAAISSGEVESICLLAGLNAEYGYTTTLQEFLSITPKRFLTNKPLRRSTSRQSQEYLYFFNEEIEFVEDIAIRYRIFFDDGSSTAVLTFNTGLFDFSFPAAAIIPVGYNALNLDADTPDGKAVTSYQVFITANGHQTETHIYDIADSCDKTGRDLVFLNSLGGVDTVHLQTVEEVSINVQKEIVERYVGMNAELQSGTYYENNVNTVRSFKASIGLKTEEERLWLQELFASARVFEVGNEKFLPITISSNSIQLVKGPAAYQGVTFDYRYRYDDIGYTRPL